MAVDLKIKSNSKQVSKKFKKFQSVLPRIIDKGIKQAGFQLIDIIRTKTKKGVDFDNVNFASYSQGYINKLNKENRSTNVKFLNIIKNQVIYYFIKDIFFY